MTAEDGIPVITIDGPSGSGKGTISQRLARERGWHFLDSGALYRLVGLAARRQGVPAEEAGRVAELARALPVRFEPRDGAPRVLLDNEDVTDAIRTETAGNDASRVAALPEVREALLELQRSFRQAPGLVADGRDMGTTVFPDAPVKVFLDASAEVRAERRYKQLKEKGLDVNLSSLVAEISERDERDRNRSVSPLQPAADATRIDTSGLDVEGVMEAVRSVCRDRLGE